MSARAFVRIRIFRIRGIYRISPSRGLPFRHNLKSRQDEYGRALAAQRRAGGILKIL